MGSAISRYERGMPFVQSLLGGTDERKRQTLTLDVTRARRSRLDAAACARNGCDDRRARSDLYTNLETIQAVRCYNGLFDRLDRIWRVGRWSVPSSPSPRGVHGASGQLGNLFPMSLATHNQFRLT